MDGAQGVPSELYSVFRIYIIVGRAFKAIEVIHLSKNIEKGRKSRTYSKGTPEKGLGSGVVNRTGWKIYRT